MYKLISLIGMLLASIIVTSPVSAKDPLQIGIILWRGETDFDRSFIQEIKKLAPDCIIKTENSAQNLRHTIHTLHNKWGVDETDMDYIITFGSRNSLKAREELQKLNYKGTHVAFGNSNKLFHAYQQRSKTKEKMLLARLTVTDTHALETFLPILKPKLIGIPFNVLEPQVKEMMAAIRATAEKNNTKIHPIRLRPDPKTFKKQISAVMDRHPNIDMLYFPLDSFLVSQAKAAAELTKKYRVLSVGTSKKFIDAGVALSIIPDFTSLGLNLAKEIHKISNGQSLYDSPIIYNQSFEIIANRDTLSKLAPHLLSSLPSTTRFTN